MEIIQEYIPQIDAINRNNLNSNYVAGNSLPTVVSNSNALLNLNNRGQNLDQSNQKNETGTVAATDLSQVTGFVSNSSSGASQYTINIAENLIATDNKLAKQIFGSAVVLAVQVTKLPIEQLVKITSNGLWFSDSVLQILNAAKFQTQYSFKSIDNVKITANSYA